ncbi:MAG: TrbI/VirB10 family protein [Beijerinckiaceae bacterium]|nr:TrbI/VirB10 family protein [Beijerinckiaceae bacterium]
MSDKETPRDGPSYEAAAGFRLRPERPRVMRLSRKVLAGLAGAASLAVMGLLIFALAANKRSQESGQELFNTENKTAPEGLGSLPKDYASLPRSVPQLGPPLPGDLGRPILNAHGAAPPAPGFEAEQRIAQESEAARTSRLFSLTGTRERRETESAGPASAAPAPPPAAFVQGQQPPFDPDWLQNMQDHKLAFLNGPADRRTVSSGQLIDPASSYVLQAGSILPAALITGIQSDLPGLITAQVTENVYDSPSGRFLLVPQGSKLIGSYDSQVSYGQSRVLLVWNRIVFPNGQSIVLERQPGADTEGYAGLADSVDYHWGNLLKTAALSTLLGIGAELGSSGSDSDLMRALRRGSQYSINQSGQQLVRRQINVQPTLTIRPGFPVRVIVNRDLVLATYQG